MTAVARQVHSELPEAKRARCHVLDYFFITKILNAPEGNLLFRALKLLSSCWSCCVCDIQASDTLGEHDDGGLEFAAAINE